MSDPLGAALRKAIWNRTHAVFTWFGCVVWNSPIGCGDVVVLAAKRGAKRTYYWSKGPPLHPLPQELAIS